MGINAKLRRDINSPDFSTCLLRIQLVMGCCRPTVLPQSE